MAGKGAGNTARMLCKWPKRLWSETLSGYEPKANSWLRIHSKVADRLISTTEYSKTSLDPCITWRGSVPAAKQPALSWNQYRLICKRGCPGRFSRDRNCRCTDYNICVRIAPLYIHKCAKCRHQRAASCYRPFTWRSRNSNTSDSQAGIFSYSMPCPSSELRPTGG